MYLLRLQLLFWEQLPVNKHMSPIHEKSCIKVCWVHISGHALCKSLWTWICDTCIHKWFLYPARLVSFRKYSDRSSHDHIGKILTEDKRYEYMNIWMYELQIQYLAMCVSAAIQLWGSWKRLLAVGPPCSSMPSKPESIAFLAALTNWAMIPGSSSFSKGRGSS